MATIRNIDWKSKLRANPLENQKNILMMDDNKMIAHTSIENEPKSSQNKPKDFYLRISWYCDTLPSTGAIAFTMLNIRIYLHRRLAFGNVLPYYKSFDFIIKVLTLL